MGSRRLLVTDLDGTLLGDDAALRRFAAWHADNRAEVLLAYATGRSLAGIDALVRDSALPRPDVSIVQVGTEIYDVKAQPWPGWDRRFSGWDADVARRALDGVPGLRRQPAPFQTRRKASFYAPGLEPPELTRLRDLVVRAGLPARLVYSCSQYLDVLPPGAGKGHAARAVARTLGIPPSLVFVFGDTANDLDLFRNGFRGTVVGNALPELSAAAVGAYRSPFPHADGIIDGLRYWDADPGSRGGRGRHGSNAPPP